MAKESPKPMMKSRGNKPAGRQFFAGDWKEWNKTDVNDKNFQGLQVFYPVDPYRPQDRKDFRSAMNNVYVYRASRILTTFTVGQGYTTTMVPRIEEELPVEQLEGFNQQPIYVPYWDRDMTIEELKDRIDKLAIDMDLAEQVFNGYMTSLEQGRCVLALTPINPNEETEEYELPKQIRYVRPEFTLRPVIDSNTAELVACYIIGARSKGTSSIIPVDRMIYITHGFNNELFSDFYGDSKIARISDICNTLNIVLNQDYERVAESTWHKPKVFGVPIPPQMVGQEEKVISEFLKNNNENAKGRDIAVTTSINKDERGVELLSATTNSGDLSALEVVRTGLIKAIITAFGLPGFMLSEGDIGKLGGNANIEEVDMFLNTEVTPERIKIENILEKQFYDVILKILFKVDDSKNIPVKIKHKYNKPTLMTLLTPPMFQVMDNMVQRGYIDENGLVDILHLQQFRKETMSKGEDISPANSWGWGDIEPDWDLWNQKSDQWFTSWGLPDKDTWDQMNVDRKDLATHWAKIATFKAAKEKKFNKKLTPV